MNMEQGLDKIIEDWVKVQNKKEDDKKKKKEDTVPEPDEYEDEEDYQKALKAWRKRNPLPMNWKDEEEDEE